MLLGTEFKPTRTRIDRMLGCVARLHGVRSQLRALIGVFGAKPMKGSDKIGSSLRNDARCSRSGVDVILLSLHAWNRP